MSKIRHNNHVNDKKHSEFLKIVKMLSVGLIAGFINGFFGAGGGLLLVPLITKVQKLESKVAHATTLACVLFMCIASSVVYIVKKQVQWKLIIFCGIGSVCGSLVGTKLLKNLKNNIIDLIFSLVLITAGLSMIIF